MPPDETEENLVIAGQDDDDLGPDITEEEAKARDAKAAEDSKYDDSEWTGLGERPLRESVINEETVTLGEGDPRGIRIGDQIKDWAGDYPARPDHEAADPNATPPYNPAEAFARARYLANGPGKDDPSFDVHDYVEADAVPPGTDLSGYLNPTYD